MVELDGVWKRYRQQVALRDVSLRCQPGCVTGVLGENGSGKSTLFRIVAGVARPTRGTVRIADQPPGAHTRSFTAYLPEVDPFYRWMQVGEQLEHLSAFYPEWDEAKAAELLQVMKLDAAAKIGELSQGQRGRLKIVAAFSWPSLLVVMDEPLNGIDPPSRRRILATLVREFRMDEQTVLMSTHLVDEVEELVERVVYLRDGEVALEGDAEELRSQKGGTLTDIFEEFVA